MKIIIKFLLIIIASGLGMFTCAILFTFLNSIGVLKIFKEHAHGFTGLLYLFSGAAIGIMAGLISSSFVIFKKEKLIIKYFTALIIITIAISVIVFTGTHYCGVPW